MCNQTETREECCCCGNTTSKLEIESCALRLQEQAFQTRSNNPGGRCYGVATMSNTIVVTCSSCAEMQRGGKHEGHDTADGFGGFPRRA
ncbi:hypothetical protein N0V84_011052 [Fusarium piperis]|uniref:Uncharacterized protein n=1 Tax=Fusarium piperis TaxID=1435070 RepID=A0A9W8TBW5_9HYPO|nr:hypothetical protein N0V84_011052 [Fusarium piperis]